MNRLSRCLTGLIALSVLTACSSDDDSGPDEYIGYLMPLGVQGLEYETDTHSGVTGANGSFRYEPGENIRFFIGDVVFAEPMPAKQYMTYIDFVPRVAEALEQGDIIQGLHNSEQLEDLLVDDPWVENRSRFLNALDDDNDADNGVFISPLNRQLLSEHPQRLDLDFDIDADVFNEEEDLEEDPNSKDSIARQIINDLCFPEDIDCDDGVGRNMPAGAVSQAYLREAQFLVGERIFLLPEVYEIEAEDTRLFEARLDLRGLHGRIADIEVVTSDELAQLSDNPPPEQRVVVGIDSVSIEEGSILFFSVGEAGESTEIIANVHLDNDYRWVRKVFRVILR